MVAINGNKSARLFVREISHPKMVNIQPLRKRGDCVDSITLEPMIHEDTKTLIWITAKDKSKYNKNKSTFFRLWLDPTVSNQTRFN